MLPHLWWLVPNILMFVKWTRPSCLSTPQLLSHPWSLLECHTVSFCVSWFSDPWACPSYVVSQSHNSKSFSGPRHQTGQEGEKKLFMQFVTNSLYSPRHNCHCAMGCCQVLCHPPSELTQAHIHVIRITSWITVFAHFYAKTFAFFFSWWTVSKLPFPWISQWLCLLPNVQKGCKILKSLSRNFHSLSWLSSVLSTPFLLLFVKCRNRIVWQYRQRTIVCP